MGHGEESAVIVIGAGPAGLAVSHELVVRRIDHVVLERGEIGESWRRYYDGLVLHTGRHLSSLPGLPIRRPAPLFVPRDRFVRYLEDYAATMRLPIRTGAGVTGARRKGGRWHLATRLGPWNCQILIVATAIAASPVIPHLPGLEAFRGRVRHSIEYRRPEPFRGRRVLVVGAGNSGGEIAAELATVAAAVTIAIRSGVVVVLREIAGIPSQYLGMLVRRLPRVLAREIVAIGTRRRARRLPPSLPQSTARPLDEIPLIGMHLPDAIAVGSVRVRPGVVGFTPDAVRFADGSEAPFDEVILATGFRAALEPFDGVQRDRRGFARRTGRVTSGDQSDLFFVGHEYDASGGLANIRRDAPDAAKRIEAALSGATAGPRGRSSRPRVTGFPPGLSLPDGGMAAALLGLLTACFALRVAGQFIVSRSAPSWLPPMPEWYSGLVPYPRLLAIQLAMLAVMAATVIGLALGWPAVADPRPVLGSALLLIAWPYGLSMPVRYAVRMWRHPEARWTGRTIPIVFHVVLATWLLVLGSYWRPPG